MCVESFWSDSTRLVVRNERSRGVDTISLLGVRRLDVFAGLRSRSMVMTGAGTGAAIGTLAALFAQVMVRSDRVKWLDTTLVVKTPTPSIVKVARWSAPALTLAGAIAGAVVGREHWIRVPVKISVFPQG